MKRLKVALDRLSNFIKCSFNSTCCGGTSHSAESNNADEYFHEPSGSSRDINNYSYQARGKPVKKQKKKKKKWR